MSTHTTARYSTRALVFLVIAAFVALHVFSAASLLAQGLVAKAPTDNSVTLQWTAPGDDGGTGTASSYEIRYSLIPITELNWNSATQLDGEPAPQAAGNAESFEVTGLNSGTQYYFAIKTADEVPNWSPLSNVVTATTLDTTAPAAITDLSAQP